MENVTIVAPSYAFEKVQKQTGMQINLIKMDEIVQFIAGLIVYDLEDNWLDRILRSRYAYFSSEEQQEIIKRSQEQIKKHSDSFYIQACLRLKDFLQEYNMVNLEGFVRFRLRDYWNTLQESLEESIDGFLLEKEYQEFIYLLSYFVELQEPKINLVYVLISEYGFFQILDENQRVLKTDSLDGFTFGIDKEDLEFEDLLISSLISVAPWKLILHTAEQRIVNTIVGIFGERVSICEGCSLCGNFQKRTAERFRKRKGK